LGARYEPETGQYFTGRTYYTPNTGSYLQPPNPGGSYAIGNSEDSDPELDAILSTGRWGGLYGSYGRKGYSDLQQMPQWQPGSRDRQQISAMMNFIPYLGLAKMGYEALTGNDIVGGTCLSTGQRILAGFGTILSVLRPAENIGRGVGFAKAETPAVSRIASQPPPFTQQQGVQAEEAFRAWLQRLGMVIEGKGNAYTHGVDASRIGGKDLGWWFAELKPDRWWSRIKGGRQVRNRLRGGMQGPGALYGYSLDDAGEFVFRLIRTYY
jgi:hypothetical protein